MTVRFASVLGFVVTVALATLATPVHAEPDVKDVVTLNATVQLPALDPIDALPDLREVRAGPKRKAAFLELIVPLVQAENARVEADRDWLMSVRGRSDSLSSAERRRLEQLCKAYAGSCSKDQVTRELLTRVDTVPLAMVVIQAIEESGWGTSRIARESNNVFGMRCFSDGCGIAQQGTSRHFQSFETLRASVRAYLRNLNTHRAYAQLRDERYALSVQGQTISAKHLIDTLHNYSTSPDYQRQLLSLLRTNGDLIRRHGLDEVMAASPA